MIFVSAAIIGLGEGGILPLAVSLIAEHFEGGTQATALGFQGMFINIGGFFLNFVGGALAAHYFKDLFFLYFINLPLAVIILFLLPKGDIEKPQKGEKARIFTPYLFVFLVQAFFVGVCVMTVMANVAMYVFELRLGMSVSTENVHS
jgi:MFS family permease